MATSGIPDLAQSHRAVGDRPSAGASARSRRGVTPAAAPRRLAQSTAVPALVGSAALWAAFPPLNLWLLAWVAPIAWVLLIRRSALQGRRPYRTLWFAGFVFWLATLHWLRLPHPLTSIGWVALAAYLGGYLPAFVGLSRLAVHRLRFSVVLAAPVVWTGLEFIQAHLFTGFSMAGLGQSQFRWLSLIQVADLGGVYIVGTLVMFVAACIAQVLKVDGRRKIVWPLAAAAAALAAVLAYGQMRLAEPDGRPGPKIALIQGSIDTEMKYDPRRQRRIHEQYFGLSRAAIGRSRDLDLLVWPETMYRDPVISYSRDIKTPPGWPSLRRFKDDIARRRAAIAAESLVLGTPLLLGIEAYHFSREGMERYNSALYVDRNGIGKRYDKMHPVLFGEYVPFGSRLPWLYSLTPLAGGIDVGTQIPAFEVKGARLAVNICYESILAHVIRGQVARLRSRGQEPDILVNLTNDGWFWGSSELDLHLMCGVFRAVECRKPLLIAANTGFSAWIDSDGRIRRRGPRRATAVIVTDGLRLDGRASPYVRYGDWPAGICALGCLMFGLVGLADKYRSRRRLRS